MLTNGNTKKSGYFFKFTSRPRERIDTLIPYMKRNRSEDPGAISSRARRIEDEEALLEEIRQLRAAIKIYRDLVERLLAERKQPG